MKHVIVGAGNVGRATGEWLEANGETVIYNDINADLIVKLKKAGKTVSNNLKLLKDIDIFWICTLEWDVENALKTLPHNSVEFVVIRSTNRPGTTEALQEKYTLNIAHVPEFLRQSIAVEDTFNPDRIIIGTTYMPLASALRHLFRTLHVPIVVTDPTTSEVIKLVSNAWLSTQISFWNQIYELTKEMKLNPEEVANAVTLDNRISSYGSNMTGKSFGGVCLPKDTDSMIWLFEKFNIKPDIFNAVKTVNIRLGGEK